VADLDWHGPERRVRPRNTGSPRDYGLAVFSAREFEEAVSSARGGTPVGVDAHEVR
jgi:hypothetical protein